jgi:hypothetical protein
MIVNGKPKFYSPASGEASIQSQAKKPRCRADGEIGIGATSRVAAGLTARRKLNGQPHGVFLRQTLTIGRAKERTQLLSVRTGHGVEVTDDILLLDRHRRAVPRPAYATLSLDQLDRMRNDK